MHVVDERDALSFKQAPLYIGSAEREAFAEASILKENAMAGDFAAVNRGRWIAAQGETDIARRLRTSHQSSDLSVCRHLPRGNLANDVEDSVRKLSHYQQYTAAKPTVFLDIATDSRGDLTEVSQQE